MHNPKSSIKFKIFLNKKGVGGLNTNITRKKITTQINCFDIFLIQDNHLIIVGQIL
jgi:hypothetical protein